MQKIKDVLRLWLSEGLSICQIRASTKICVGAIQKPLARVDELGLTGPVRPELDEAALARLFTRSPRPAKLHASRRWTGRRSSRPQGPGHDKASGAGRRGAICNRK